MNKTIIDPLTGRRITIGKATGHEVTRQYLLISTDRNKANARLEEETE